MESQKTSSRKDELKETTDKDPFERLYGFFMSMDKEDKEDLVTEVLVKTKLSMSTFYNRLRETYPWTESEKVNVGPIIIKYRKKYKL